MLSVVSLPTKIKSVDDILPIVIVKDLSDDAIFSRKKWQVWHLFIWSVLSGKPEMTRFFVAQTAAPLGKSFAVLRVGRKKTHFLDFINFLEKKIEEQVVI